MVATVAQEPERVPVALLAALGVGAGLREHAVHAESRKTVHLDAPIMALAD
jgi:hypothetical protein